MVPVHSSTLFAANVTSDDEPIGAPPLSIETQEPVAATPKPKTKKEKPPAPKGIVGLAKARLREVKQELRRMQALEKECGELERLIAAAEDNKPRAQPRALTKIAG